MITLFAQERGHFLCPSPRTVSLVAAAALLPASGRRDKRGARIGLHNFMIDTVMLTQYSQKANIAEQVFESLKIFADKY